MMKNWPKQRLIVGPRPVGLFEAHLHHQNNHKFLFKQHDSTVTQYQRLRGVATQSNPIYFPRIATADVKGWVRSHRMYSNSSHEQDQAFDRATSNSWNHELSYCMVRPFRWPYMDITYADVMRQTRLCKNYLRHPHKKNV